MQVSGYADTLFAESMGADLARHVWDEAPGIWQFLLLGQETSPTNPSDACLAWARALMAYGHEVEIIEGVYSGETQWRAHIWLEVDGSVFDPTAARFVPQDGLFRALDYLPEKRNSLQGS